MITSIFQFPASASSMDSDNIITNMYEFLEGDIPKGKSLVYYTQPGVDGKFFGIRKMYKALKSGGTCIFIASHSRSNHIKSQLREMGLDVDTFKNKFFFVDVYSPLIVTPSKEKYVVLNPDNINDLSKVVMDLLKELPPSTVVFESLSTIMDLCGEDETVEAVKKWNKTARLFNHIIVYNFTAWPYSQKTLKLIQKDLFNAVISVGINAKCVTFGRCFEDD
jgi:KaiC/GvpD/RAD55 family RecA-like ATPase